MHHPTPPNSSPSEHTARHHRPWYQSSGLALIVCCLCGVICLGTLFAMLATTRQPTVLILKRDGCTYLQYHHIETRAYPADGMCAAQVTFDRHGFDAGGTVILADRNLEMPEAQIATVEVITNAPESPAQWSWDIGLLASAIATLGSLVWFIVVL